jgi:hypothetical protein
VSVCPWMSCSSLYLRACVSVGVCFRYLGTLLPGKPTTSICGIENGTCARQKCTPSSTLFLNLPFEPILLMALKHGMRCENVSRVLWSFLTEGPPCCLLGLCWAVRGTNRRLTMAIVWYFDQIHNGVENMTQKVSRQVKRRLRVRSMKQKRPLRAHSLSKPIAWAFFRYGVITREDMIHFHHPANSG